ncbi:MAG: hypothetical protein ACN6QU_10155, partial [Paraburkholderia terricola]
MNYFDFTDFHKQSGAPASPVGEHHITGSRTGSRVNTAKYAFRFPKRMRPAQCAGRILTTT